MSTLDFLLAFQRWSDLARHRRLFGSFFDIKIGKHLSDVTTKTAMSEVKPPAVIGTANCKKIVLFVGKLNREKRPPLLEHANETVPQAS